MNAELSEHDPLDLVLTKENIDTWKNIYGQHFREKYKISNYENCMSDEDFLDEYEGFAVRDAIYDELQAWND